MFCCCVSVFLESSTASRPAGRVFLQPSSWCRCAASETTSNSKPHTSQQLFGRKCRRLSSLHHVLLMALCTIFMVLSVAATSCLQINSILSGNQSLLMMDSLHMHECSRRVTVRQCVGPQLQGGMVRTPPVQLRAHSTCVVSGVCIRIWLQHCCNQCKLHYNASHHCLYLPVCFPVFLRNVGSCRAAVVPGAGQYGPCQQQQQHQKR